MLRSLGFPRWIVAAIVLASLAVAILGDGAQPRKPDRPRLTTAELILSFERGVAAREDGQPLLARPAYTVDELGAAWESGWTLTDQLLKE
jgi:hypothetical protein